MRRGINDNGEVANDVETELIIAEDFPFQNQYKSLFSFVFVRGSIPIFWGHEPTKINPKPAMVIDENRDPEFKKTEIHFKQLNQAYGNEICVLNLVKNSPKSSETILGRIFKKFADGYSNKLKTRSKGPKLRFRWIDFHSIYSKNEADILKEVQEYGRLTLQNVGIFQYSVFENIVSLQKGVIRINCVDCLDRTNNAMACISSVVLAQCLLKMDVSDPELVDAGNSTVKNELLSILFEIFGVF